MDIDIYQACPCHTEKKIKFCCGKDIVADLNRVLELNQSKQTVAALEHLDRTIAKLGPRDCLVTIKTHLLINLHEYEQAKEINTEFLRTHPHHPIGHQHRALLLAAESKADEAIDALQDALDSSPPDEVPMSMANAFRIIGMLLLAQGKVLAGRAHLVFASELRDGKDDSISNLILQTYRSPHLPLLLKHEFVVTEADLADPERKIFDNARKLAQRGRWRAALRRIDKLLGDGHSSPALLRAKAVWNGCLGDLKQSSDAWLEHSRASGIDFDEAAESRTMSLLTDGEPLSDEIDITRITYPITELESLTEAAVANPRLVTGAAMSQQFVDPDAPPPMAAYLLLDRDEVKSARDVDASSFPKIAGEMLVFGKQTDRDARLEFIFVRDEHHDAARDSLHSVLGNWLAAPSGEEAIGKVPANEHAMSFRWHLPSDTTIEQQKEFIRNQRQKEFLEIWPSIPFRCLDGSSPLEAAKRQDYRTTVAALVLMLEQTADSHLHNEFDFQRLRDKLGLPETSTVDPGDRPAASLSPIQQQRLDFQKLDDRELVQVYVTATTIGNMAVVRKCSPVILERPELEEYLHFEMVYGTLAKITADNDEAINYMQKARQHAKNAGRPQGHLLVDELEIRLERGMAESCPELLRIIQTSCADDPQVQYHLATVLARFGIIDHEGRPARQLTEPDPAAQAPPPESAIWTPDAAATTPAAPAAQSESKSKLWIPD